MKANVEDLRQLCLDVLGRREVSEDDAHVIADILLEADLRGRHTHGLIRLPGIAERCELGPRKPMRLVKDGPSFALIDGQENLGYLVAHRCARTAIGKADSTGVAVVGARNTGHCGMLGYYVGMIADAGMVGVMTCDTSPRVVPWGGTTPVLGTNPIAAAFPSRDGQVLADLSTAAITSGQILMAIKDDKKIPDGCALGPDGKLTTDPVQARLGGGLPSGGHKGYALSIVVQLISGVLMGATPVPEAGRDYGLFILAISPGIFGDREDFQEGVSQLVERIKAARLADGVVEILLPGERASRQREFGLREGIELDEALADELRRL
jgi:L-2-hydroxycarboxylate dehydrogenase (NAD+)